MDRDSSSTNLILEFEMKQLLRLIPVMLMITALSVAGCGDKGGDDKGGDKGTDTSSSQSDDNASKSDDNASNTPAAGNFVAMKVSLPNMHWT